MAYTSDKQIYELNSAAPLTGTELVPIASNGQEAKTTTTQAIADLATNNTFVATKFHIISDILTTGTVINHNLNLTDYDSFLIQILSSANSPISANLSEFSANSVKLIAQGFSQLGCKITIIG